MDDYQSLYVCYAFNTLCAGAVHLHRDVIVDAKTKRSLVRSARDRCNATVLACPSLQREERRKKNRRCTWSASAPRAFLLPTLTFPTMLCRGTSVLAIRNGIKMNAHRHGELVRLACTSGKDDVDVLWFVGLALLQNVLEIIGVVINVIVTELKES